MSDTPKDAGQPSGFELSEAEQNASILARAFRFKLIFWVALIALLGLDLASKSWAEVDTTRVVEFTESKDLIYYERTQDGGLESTMMVDFEDSKAARDAYGKRFPKVIHQPKGDLQPAESSLIWLEDAKRAAPDGDEFWPGFLHFKWAENYGAAFSMGHGKTYLLALISIGVLGVMFYYVVRLPNKRWITLLFLGLVAGGAIGNLYDRLTHETVSPELKAHAEAWRQWGERSLRERTSVSLSPRDVDEYDQEEARTAVRDFLYWPFEIPVYSSFGMNDEDYEKYGGRKWPVFNVADVGIVGGVIGLIIIMLLTPSPQPRKKRAKSENAEAESSGDSAGQDTQV